MKYLRIRNWDKHQKIAGNRAPYVTIQTSILLDMEYMCLPDRERLCFLLLIVFAGTSSNKIPADPCHIQHLCHFDEQPDIDMLIKYGFLEKFNESKHADMLENNEKKLKGQRDRQKRHRDKTTSHSNVTAMSQGETERETDIDKDKKKEQRARKRRTTLPWDWIMPDDYREYCKTKRPELDADLVAENFLDYYLSHGKLMVDWKRTWQRWVRNEHGTYGQGRNGTISPADEYALRVERENEIISKFNAGIVEDNGEVVSPSVGKEQRRDRRPGIPRLDD